MKPSAKSIEGSGGGAEIPHRKKVHELLSRIVLDGSKIPSQTEGEPLEDYDIVDGGIKQHSDNLALSTLRMVL